MPLDSSIPLRVKTLDLGSAADSYFQAKNQSAALGMQKQKMERESKSADLQDKLTEEQLAQSKFKSMDDREKSRMGSVIYGAAELKPYLDSNDIEGARNFLTRRRTNLEKRIAAGENVDTAETDEALDHLDKNPEQLKQNISNVITFGQQTGILKSKRDMTSDIPMSEKEHLYYKSLSPTERKEYLNVKRNTTGEGQFLNQDGVAVPIVGYAPGRENIKTSEARGTKIGTETGDKIVNQPKAQSALQSSFDKFDNVTKTIDKAIPKVNRFTAGAGSILSYIPGSSAKDLDADIKTIVANFGFDELQEMRDNSKTGGALGNVATKEIEFLQAAKTNLETAQSPSQLKEKMEEAKIKIAASKKRIQEAYDRDYRGLDQGPGERSMIVGRNPDNQNQSQVLQSKSGHKFEVIRLR